MFFLFLPLVGSNPTVYSDSSRVNAHPSSSDIIWLSPIYCMTVKVVGNWELSWNTPIKEAELWNFPLRAYQVSEWYMWPVSGIKHSEWRRVNLHERHDLNEILEENQDLKRVYLEPANKAFTDVKPVMLTDYEHPKDVLYIFGSAHYNAALIHQREEDDVVMVPNRENSGVLWPHQVLVALFYDRLIKGWQ